MNNGAWRAELANVRGMIFDIQRYSLHDGPGLRTNAFLKGCSLACQWCSNPESRRRQPEIAFFERSCFRCGDCLVICPEGGIRSEDERVVWESQRCTTCGECVQVCTSGAFRRIGSEVTAGEVVEQALRDAAFYGEGGGLTLTGGEPALQPEFASAILKLAKTEGLHTAIETCGHVPGSHYAGLLPYLDLVLFDLKQVDPVIHRRGVGVENRLILENLRALADRALKLIVRIPLIPGFNADRGSLEAMADFVAGLEKVTEIHLLPYHTLARAKYQALGLEYPLGDLPPLKPEEAVESGETFRRQGFTVLVGG